MGLMADCRLRLAQGLAVEPAYLVGQMRNLRDDVFGVQAVFIVVDHVLEAGALELEVHAVAVDQLAVQLWIKCVGLQGKVEERLRQDMRRARIHRHCRAMGFALVLGRHHAKEDYPAAQAHRLADCPQAARRGAGGIARALGIDQGDFQVFAFGQLVGAGRTDHAATGDDHIIGSVHASGFRAELLECGEWNRVDRETRA
ncbi:hypothetical protein D3C85_1274290 [compost metagenome]